MGIHILIGTLVLALACFTIGMLAGAPDLLGRRRRERRVLRGEEASPAVRPVIYPDRIDRSGESDMRIEP